MALFIYAESECSRCRGRGTAYFPDLSGEDVICDDCPDCNATGRALEPLWPPPLEAVEVGVEVPRANIYNE